MSTPSAISLRKKKMFCFFFVNQAAGPPRSRLNTANRTAAVNSVEFSGEL